MRELVKIKLGAQEIGMRPTFDAYGEIEARLGALRLVYTRVMTGGGTLADLTCIVVEGAKQVDQFGERALDENKVAKLIFEAGPFSDEVLAPICDFLAALGWTPEQRKKIEAEAEKIAAAQTLSA